MLGQNKITSMFCNCSIIKASQCHAPLNQPSQVCHHFFLDPLFRRWLDIIFIITVLGVFFLKVYITGKYSTTLPQLLLETAMRTVVHKKNGGVNKIHLEVEFNEQSFHDNQIMHPQHATVFASCIPVLQVFSEINVPLPNLCSAFSSLSSHICWPS